VEDALRDIGAFAGLAAFIGLGILSLLYFSQARDVRRLREWAGRAPERDAEDVEATSDLAAERAEELRKIEEERRQREETAAVETAATEKREVRRRRREAGLPEATRWERIRERFGRRPGGRGMPEPRYLAVIIGAVIVIGVAAVVGATQILGGEEETSPNGVALRPGQIEVSVLNGTSAPGLAARISDELESDGFRTGAIGNSEDPFTESVVMFRRGHRPEAVKVARDLKINRVQLMISDVRDRSAPANVAVVAGEDLASRL
jgi:LytR cell envelope-related transcriptional attenuator